MSIETTGLLTRSSAFEKRENQNEEKKNCSQNCEIRHHEHVRSLLKSGAGRVQESIRLWEKMREEFRRREGYGRERAGARLFPFSERVELGGKAGALYRR